MARIGFLTIEFFASSADYVLLSEVIFKIGLAPAECGMLQSEPRRWSRLSEIRLTGNRKVGEWAIGSDANQNQAFILTVPSHDLKSRSQEKMGACSSERRERRKSDLKMSRKKIINQIWAQILPDYQVKKTGVYKVVDDHAMLGVEVETSDFTPSTFYIWSYWIPLCAPLKSVYFNLGFRVRGPDGERWAIKSPDELARALGHLRPLLIQQSILLQNQDYRIESAEKQAVEYDCLHAYQAWAYTLARYRRMPDLRRVISAIGQRVYVKPWQNEIASNIVAIDSLAHDAAELEAALFKNVSDSRQVLAV